MELDKNAILKIGWKLKDLIEKIIPIKIKMKTDQLRGLVISETQVLGSMDLKDVSYINLKILNFISSTTLWWRLGIVFNALRFLCFFFFVSLDMYLALFIVHEQ